MFKLDNEEQLKKAFRPKDMGALELSPDFVFPMVVLDYLAWVHPAGGKTFLVFSAERGMPPTGIAFDISSGGPTGLGPNMCDFCHSVGAGTQVGLLTARLNSKKRLGVNACFDLSCKVKMEDDALRSGKSALPFIQKMIERVARFASEGLKMDLSGAGRP